MKLIIAEKPDLARNIAQAIGEFEKKSGYLENKEYIITWAFGHLYQLKTIDEYLGKKTLWKDIKLPFFPEEFSYIVQEDKKEQVYIINKLIKSENITEIINAGDADREGQIIIDIILNELNNKKPVKRLWLKDLTKETIKKAFKEIKDNELYKNLYNEGISRTKLDWIYGINLTRYVTLKVGDLYPVGRVIVPIVEYIANRDNEIKNFVPEKYYILESKIKYDGKEIKLSLKNEKFMYSELNKAKELADKLNKNYGIVTNIQNNEKVKGRPKLFSLSTLQAKMSKEYKISMQDTLKTVQELYEKKYVTYPRTNTEYLASAEKETVKNLIDKYKNSFNFDLKLQDTKRIFDDSKVESHSALLPTINQPKDLNINQSRIYTAIFNRFLCNTINEDYIVNETKIDIKVADKIFTLKGETLIQKGYTVIEPENIKNELPLLNVNDKLKVNFIPNEKITQAPPKISEEILINYLKNPMKEEIKNSNDDQEYTAILKGTEIGTVATRDTIVSNAIKAGYITQKNSIFSITEKGNKLIEILKYLNINLFKEKTVKMQEELKMIYNNKIDVNEFLYKHEHEITKVISQNKHVEKEIQKSNQEIIGKCPYCKRNILESSKSYYCEGYKDNPKCNFVIWKNNKFFESIGKKITKNNVKKLLDLKPIVLKNCISSRNKKEFNCRLELDLSNKKYVNFKFADKI